MTPDAQISAAFKEIAQSLRRLTSPNAAPQTVADNAAIVKHIEDALIEMIPRADLSEDAIRKGLQTNSSRTVRALAKHLGEDGLRGSRQPDLFNLQDVIRAGHINTLKALIQEGIPIQKLATRMIPHAYRHRDAAYMDFIRNDLGCKNPIHDCVEIHKIIDACPDIFAEAIATEMKADLANPESTLVKNLANYAKSSLKAMAVLSFTRTDLSQIIDQDQYFGNRHPSVVDVYHKTKSNHGRLTLMRDEPDLLSVLRRSPNSRFFGLMPKQVDTTPDWN